ncbi:MAG: hypothetical protein ACLUTA_17315 [Blautia wexlerae]
MALFRNKRKAKATEQWEKRQWVFLKKKFGVLPDGEQVKMFHLENKSGHT